MTDIDEKDGVENQDVTTSYLTKYVLVAGKGDGSWSDLACGCRYGFGWHEGRLTLIPCDEHSASNVPVAQIDKPVQEG